MYITISQVYGMAGITTNEVGEEAVIDAIKAAESVVDRYCNTTFWNIENNGSVSSVTDNTLTDDTQSWSLNAYDDEYVWIYSGTGSGQLRLINSNDENTLTVDIDWSVNPDNTSKYRIIHTGSPFYVEEVVDGNDMKELILKHKPVRVIDSITINDTSVTPSNVYLYNDSGKLVLGNNAEVGYWSMNNPQSCKINYFYGVYPISEYIKRLTGIYASLFILQTQMGTTHNIPSTYSLPEGSVTIGQAYINIKGTWDTLMRNKAQIEELIPRYHVFTS